MINPDFLERAELLNTRDSVERSILSLRDRTSPYLKISKDQALRIFDAAHDVVCKAIEKAAEPRNLEAGYTDIVVSMIRTVNFSQLPGAKQAACELAHEFILNSYRILDVCPTAREREYRKDQIAETLDLVL